MSYNAKRFKLADANTAKKIFIVVVLTTLTQAFVSTGCSRSYYRRTADAETKLLIDEKISVSNVPTIRQIPVDRASRMFDPFNPDRPPMPEDDNVAHRYMQRIDGKKHYPLWDVNGWTNTTESPDWWQMLPLDERGVLVLDSDLSVKLAILHSPQYQSEIETLYLSAIDVSSERFLLDNQFYAGWQTSYTADGPDRRGAGGASQSNLTTGPFGRQQRPFLFSRSFANGANLLVGFANTMTWQLSGPDTQSANTLLDFSLIQPLLRGGGRDIVLERLTLAERTLLQNVRAFERYKTGFYVGVTAGRAAEPGPSRRGGLFGGAGLQGFTGLGGGFGTVGSVQQNVRAVAAGAGGFGGGGAVPTVGGILGLIQTQLQIRNAEENIARLQDNLLRFDDTLREQLTKVPATQDTIPSQQLQVAQARQALISSQAQLFSSRNGYEASLDQFKVSMGLPPYLCVEIQDPILNQFNLISPELRLRRNEVAKLRDNLGEANSAILDRSVSRKDAVSGESFRTIQASEVVDELLGKIDGYASQFANIRSQIVSRDIPEILKDLQNLNAAIPSRKEQLEKLRKIHDEERDLICTLLPTNGLDDEFFSTAALDKLPSALKVDLERLANRIDGYEQRAQKLQNDLRLLREQPLPVPLADNSANNNENSGDSKTGVLADDRNRFGDVRDKAILQSQNLLADLADDVLALQVLQARARTESVLLPEIDISPRDAIEIARRYRLDWMNARTSLVDSWRSVEVVADALESYLDLVVSGDMQNAGSNSPLSFQGKTGRLRAGLQWDSPLTRLQERNNYRQSLIEYQQSKRNFYLYEDSVWQTLRSELRNIRFNQFNFELQRFAVRVAAEQIILNEDLRQVREALSQGSGPTAARDSVSALSDLLQAQNTFLNVWVFYEGQRRNLDQDLGTIQVDSEGIWVDPGRITADRFLGEPTQEVMEEEVIGGEVIIPIEDKLL